MEFSSITKEIIEKAKLNKKTIILPETSDLRVLKAAEYISKNDIANVVLIVQQLLLPYLSFQT